MSEINTIRTSLRQILWQDEFVVLDDLIKRYGPDEVLRGKIESDAIGLVNTLRHDSTPALMEIFMAEYGLSTQEGVALMCLAEALLRVPDAHTIDDLIEDKIAPSEWGKHLGQSASALVNASTWGLLLTGKVLADEPRKSVSGYLHQAVKRLGEPVIRAAVTRAMKELGQQFVLGETIESAWKRGSKMMDKGYTYSFDMLGEAARTQDDADAYFESYKAALTAIAKRASANDVAENPGISIKLSALHPRYESLQYSRVLSELCPRVLELCQMAANANIGLNIDAEEADRLDLSLDVIEQVLSDESLASWEGFGVVVQAYGKRASATVDWLYQLACDLDRKLMIRLVKGAYWDTEIKLAQVEGLSAFPLFTQKASTDAAYICIAKQLLSKADRLYSQFATHNAHTVCAVIQLADSLNTNHYEFQRLHGMGETLHDVVMASHNTRCRIYAPVGSHKDLLAYLVRRLLENGANSSFVSQIVNEDIPAAAIATDPFKLIEHGHTPVTPPAALFGERKNAQGWNVFDPIQRHALLSARDQYAGANWQVASITTVDVASAETHTVINPADLSDTVGSAAFVYDSSIANVIEHTQTWCTEAAQRASTLRAAADLYEKHTGEIVAILQREAGKTVRDAIAEIREAVDFLRYYADQSLSLERDARGIMVCISPWNFPLAIFTGQIAAALAAGSGVVAKPAESTNIIAVRAVQWLHEAGVPADCLQLVLGTGQALGHSLCSHPAVAGVCFTGSTPTAQRINQTMAAHLAPSAPLIAETGGLNAMIVDSTALPEQVVRDVMISAFQSAGQRCSALRMLYIQEDVYEQTLEMLIGAMKCWYVGDPWDLSTDAGPLINAAAHQKIETYINSCRDRGALRFQSEPQSSGGYTLPATLIEVSGIEALGEEIFGPVLHVAKFKASKLDDVIQAINATGYGLTFGLHSRIDDRVETVCQQVRAGNIYVNRNQIGAIVGSQPFGGEGLSGTGPKAGGPHYLAHFTQPESVAAIETDANKPVKLKSVQTAIDQLDIDYFNEQQSEILPGPTGESNRWASYGRGLFLCLGPTHEAAKAQADICRQAGCAALVIAPGAELDGVLAASALTHLEGFDGVISWADEQTCRAYKTALAARDGAILPILAGQKNSAQLHIERHVCVDTTAAGGNVELLASL